MSGGSADIPIQGLTAFHINGAVAVKPMIQGDSSNHAPSANTAS